MIDEKLTKENINYNIKTPKKSVIPRSEKQIYVKVLRKAMSLYHLVQLERKTFRLWRCINNVIR